MADQIPFVRICDECQKEFPEVNKAVVAAEKSKQIDFSHGKCKRHLKRLATMIPNQTREQIKANFMKISASTTTPPDLAEHPNLVKMYSQGIFTPEQLQQSQQQNLKERLQKLAHILK